MDTLYPDLHEKFKMEGVCPICLMEMELTPRFSCANGHTICYRCKPHFYGCPTCKLSLDIKILPEKNDDPSYAPPPPTHYFPHPIQATSETFACPFYPTAPPMGNEEFLNQERGNPWRMPMPPEDPQLYPCAYSYLGCWIKLPQHLRLLHESRCQFRPHMEENELPTDLRHDQNDLIECGHSVVGCKVRMPAWRKTIHENVCNYKEKFLAMNDVIESIGCVTINDDPEEMIDCRYINYGCMVRMPRRKKYTHEQKCNYRVDIDEDDDNHLDEWEQHYPNIELDPDEQVDCKWSDYGCLVRPKRYRKSIHEEKCNYRMEECIYKHYGCDAVFEPSRKYAHEHSCGYMP
ncbi:uncharacterized protein LOC124950736 [Vespa velutina]|uniref:uncharacterized protein LOC124950736 n=1 Tax=Vespa velutina TaxID=202808 RepID=UPI001FB55FB2|nr:uncharacterized protein LOC124950736 [Vespa velutina]